MTIPPSPDTERVLGQIARSEMRCGPSAARQIAARHQEAYGDAVWGSTPAAAPSPNTVAVVPSTRGRRNINHGDVAAALKAESGAWQLVGEWPSRGGAESAALRIRTAYRAPMYEPSGSFEARTTMTEMGCRVEARYVGSVSADEAWADAVAGLAAGGGR